MSKFHFLDREFWCKCKNTHCYGKNVSIRPDLIQRLNRIREALGAPITVTSGFRCEDHNRAIGGSKASKHLTGEAVDIKAEDMEKLWSLVQEEFKDGGIGDGRPKGFIHVDVGSKRRWKY